MPKRSRRAKIRAATTSGLKQPVNTTYPTSQENLIEPVSKKATIPRASAATNTGFDSLKYIGADLKGTAIAAGIVFIILIILYFTIR
jgi:hypothetical protein